MSRRADELKSIFLAFLLISSSARLLVSPAHAESITISSDACSHATQHVPDADVTFKPGVDINGQAVAPADLPPDQGGTAPMAAPTKFNIPLFFDLQQALHLSGSNYVTPTASVGEILYDNGRITFNGQPLNDEAQVALAAACQQNRAPAIAKPSHKPDVLHGN